MKTELRNHCNTDVPTLCDDEEGNTAGGARREPQVGVPESTNLSMRRNSVHENRETPLVPLEDCSRGRLVKAYGRKTSMHADGESDGPVVPVKQANNAGTTAAESVEGRGSTKGNAEQEASRRTQCRISELNGLDRVRRVAKRDKGVRLTALLHHVTVDLLRESFFALKRDAAPGLDGVMWQEYEKDLETRLPELHGSIHRGTYRAVPSRRVWIPKADGRQRPLGIASLEDKIVQGAVRTVLECIYENDFLGFSYGFRPGRNQHNALDALTVALHRRHINWVLDADIRGFFDAIDHVWLMKFLEHRIGDRRVLRLIRKWLRAGVVEEGRKQRTVQGTPQGAVISPLLANVFLHYVLDLWVHQWRTRHARGDVVIVRYADDFVMGFQYQEDAQRCLAALHTRMAHFGLSLHPDKTRLIEFGRYAAERRRRRGQPKPETFDFLGFTHCCGRTCAGAYAVIRKSIAKRLRAKLQVIKMELRRRMHAPVAATGAWLQSVVRGWLNYHAVPFNYPRLEAFTREVGRLWRHTLRRRSHKGRRLTWARFQRLLDRWIPKPAILHPHPYERFAVSHPR
jgi:group II intron reverse transcriptase/maturase